MKKGTAMRDKNSGLVLTIPVKTMDSLEAMKLLRAGHPIDVAAGYYSQSGILEKDFYMMDNIDKLHALAAYREQMAIHKSDYESQVAAANEELARRKAEQVTKQNQDNGTEQK